MKEMSYALYVSVLIVAIITGLFVVATIVSVIFAILEFAWWFGQDYWAPLLLLALFVWMLRSNLKSTPPAMSVPHQSPSATRNRRPLKTQSQSIQKKKDPRPQSLAARKNKLAFMQSQKVKQGTGKP